MKQKTFFSIAAIIFILIVGFFSIQLLSSPEHECRAYFDFDCDSQAQVACEGSDYMYLLGGQWCLGSKCRGVFQIYCEDIDDPFNYIYNGNVTCDDYGNPDCGES